MYVPLIELQGYFGCSDPMELLTNPLYSKRLADTAMWIDDQRIYIDRKCNKTLTYIEPREDGLYETKITRGVLDRIKIDVIDFTNLTGTEYEINFKIKDTPFETVKPDVTAQANNNITLKGLILTCVTITVLGTSAYRAYTKDKINSK